MGGFSVFVVDRTSMFGKSGMDRDDLRGGDCEIEYHIRGASGGGGGGGGGVDEEGDGVDESRDVGVCSYGG